MTNVTSSLSRTASRGHTNCMRNHVGMASTAHRISTHPSEQTVRVVHDGEVLAESSRAIALEETGLPTRFYLPREDVRMELLTPTDTSSHCPFKDDASYYSAAGVTDAFWVYENPSEQDAKPIAGLLAPWPRRVEVIVE
jgi:uncharacterized protein (DUF427 family)